MPEPHHDPNVTCFHCGKWFYRRPRDQRRSVHKRFFCGVGCYGAWERGENNPAAGQPTPCRRCGVHFYRNSTYRGTRSEFYCSADCMEVGRGMRLVKLTCRHCKEGFVKGEKGRDTYSKHFCSQACMNASHWNGYTGRPAGPKTLSCRQCQNAFCASPSGRDCHSQYYCSQACMSAAGWNQRGGQAAKPQPCQQCGQAFDATRKGRDTVSKLFCSRGCLAAAGRKCLRRTP